MKKIELKIYGERNTGTNYLTKLIKQNFDIMILPGVAPTYLINFEEFIHSGEILKDIYFSITFKNNLGWKHSQVLPLKKLASSINNKRNINFLTITKNPYSWLLSLYKNPYHNKVKPLTFEEFISSQYTIVKRENTIKKNLTPVEIWNLKNKSYIKLKENYTALNLKYEDLLNDPESIITQVHNKFGFKRRFAEFTNINNSTKGATKSFTDYQEYYLNEKWRSNLNLTPIMIGMINEMLDSSVMNYYNYKFIN